MISAPPSPPSRRLRSHASPARFTYDDRDEASARPMCSRGPMSDSANSDVGGDGDESHEHRRARVAERIERLRGDPRGGERGQADGIADERLRRVERLGRAECAALEQQPHDRLRERHEPDGGGHGDERGEPERKRRASTAAPRAHRARPGSTCSAGRRWRARCRRRRAGTPSRGPRSRDTTRFRCARATRSACSPPPSPAPRPARTRRARADARSAGARDATSRATARAARPGGAAREAARRTGRGPR